MATGTFSPGPGSLTVKIPNSYYQIDFVCGTAISQLEPSQNGNIYGPDCAANILYHAEGRYISSDNGGTTMPTSPEYECADAAHADGDNHSDEETDGFGHALGRLQPRRHGHLLPVRAGVHVQYASLCSAVYTDVVTVSGNGTYTTSQGNNPGGFVPTAVGTYQWVASYSGDPNNSMVTSPFGSEPETVGTNITISGTKYLDVTGNGFSADDTPQSGVTINLYMETNGTSGLQNTGLNADTLVTHATTAADGTYSFPNLMPGTYYVQEVVPASYLQTGGGPNTTPDGNTYYTVTVAANSGNHGANNFDDFHEICTPSEFTNLCYTVVDCYGHVTHPSSLSGNVSQGSTVTVNFTWNGTETGDSATLVSYIAPNGNFNTSNLQGQVIFQQQSVALMPGKSPLPTRSRSRSPIAISSSTSCAAWPSTTWPRTRTSTTTPRTASSTAARGAARSAPLAASRGWCSPTAMATASSSPGEAGIQNVTVTLTGHDYTGAAVNLTTTTNSSGQYSFGGLQASNAAGYTITVSTPSGYIQESPATITTYLNTNSTSSGNNFAEIQGSLASGGKSLYYWEHNAGSITSTELQPD